MISIPSAVKTQIHGVSATFLKILGSTVSRILSTLLNKSSSKGTSKDHMK